MKDLRRRIIFSILIGSFFGLALHFGSRLADEVFNHNEFIFNATDIIFPFTLSFIFSFICYFLLELKIKEGTKELKIKRWKIFVPLFITSTIMLAAFYPGHHPADSHTMLEIFETGKYWTHFPPFVCVIIGSFFALGKFIGNVSLGFALMIFLQSILVDFALTEAIFYCSKKLKMKLYPVLMVLFFIIHPLVQTLIIRAGQDTIFGGLLLLTGVELLKISEDENYFNKKRKFIFLGILFYLLCITRNNGVYVLILVALASIVSLKNSSNRKYFLPTIIIPIVAFFGFQNAFVNNFVAIKDSFFQETINMPILQIARSMKYNPDEDFKKELDKYFIQDGSCKTWLGIEWYWENYDRSSGISDPYKDCMRPYLIEENALDFFGLWARIGLKNPGHYIEAPLVFTLSLYYPYTDYYREPKDITYQWHRYIDSYYVAYDYDGLETTKFITPLKSFLDNFVFYQDWSRVPILHQLWRGTFTTYVCFISIMLVLYKRKRKYLLPLSLTFGLILTVILAPVALFRYLFPAVLMTPIMIYIIIKSMIK